MPDAPFWPLLTTANLLTANNINASFLPRLHAKNFPVFLVFGAAMVERSSRLAFAVAGVPAHSAFSAGSVFRTLSSAVCARTSFTLHNFALPRFPTFILEQSSIFSALFPPPCICTYILSSCLDPNNCPSWYVCVRALPTHRRPSVAL